MPLQAAREARLGEIYRDLNPRPLEPGDPRYVPVWEMLDCDDRVSLMQTHIKFSAGESMQFFSGFSGSGKSTELKRLQKKLEAAGYFVVYADALDYINGAQPIDISDLLIVLAGAFSDALERGAQINVAGESYWARLKNWLLTTVVSLTEVSFKAQLADIKLSLKSTPTFRQRMHQALADRTGELRASVSRFFEDAVQALRKHGGDDLQIVFLLDSLEKIRGSILTDEQEVFRSVQRLFVTYFNMLDLPYVHIVYTVPPWLQFVMPNAVDFQLLCGVKLWKNDAARTPSEPGLKAMREVVRRRFRDDGLQLVFGAGPDASVDRLIEMCGGHFRDLMMLLREVVLRARNLPVGPEVIEAAIASVRSSFLPIAIDDAKWLDDISRTRSADPPSADPQDASRLTRLLDTHMVLYLTNSEDWYDVHPLIRDEVANIVKRHGSS